MDITVSDYEKLGKFYLGRTYDTATKELDDELVMYDSKDLVTHGVVLGMTGSGKTGLCIALLEEAAMDNIPAIVIDPKGDISNLLLQFPELRGSDFRPWINEDDARKKNLTPDEFADRQAETWRNGLESWGQGSDRIARFADKVDVNVFTPGSSAGIPVSILSSLDVPEFEILDDPEMLAERIESTVSSLLSLMGLDADPIQDPEHILLSNIFHTCWTNDESLTLQSLIGYIQSPPFSSVGVISIDEFYNEKKRRDLAMRLNNLLASPGFSVWLKGVPLDIQSMLTAPDGRNRISIFSIAHLSDSERMFFVSLLLNQMLGWMRAQSGTTSLRALLYMDEIFGYLPPTANPPSKKPMMTMLKQARAFGLGVLLATQNPVDLDYKALSNIGTWFLGRLQTERDKARVLEGLEGAAASQDSQFDRQRIEEILAGLGSRVFLLNNVHDDGLKTFHVRWVMSYLRGPLARGQIKELMDPKRDRFEVVEHKPKGASERMTAAAQKAESNKPVVSSRIDEFFLPVMPEFLNEELVYLPAILRAGSVRFDDNKIDVHGTKDIHFLTQVDERDSHPEWSETQPLPPTMDLTHLQRQPHNAREFGALPAFALESENYTQWKDEFVDHIYHEQKLTVMKAPAFEMYSQPGESEVDFRARLRHKARELRDEAKKALEDAYQQKIEDIEDDMQKAMDKVQEQAAQANAARVSAAMSIGGSILSAILGGRSRGVSATRARTGANSASRAWKEGRDVERAKEQVAELEDELQVLEKDHEQAVDQLDDQFDPDTTPLEPHHIDPFKKNIRIKTCGLVWMPFIQNGKYGLEEAWT